MSLAPCPKRILVCLIPSLLAALAPACGGGEAERQTATGPDMPTFTRETILPGERGGVDPVRLIEAARVSSAEGEEPPFYRAGALAVAPDGTLYLHDPAAGRIHAFAPDGTPGQSLGGPGEGPGELSEVVTALAVAGDRLVAVDELNGRLSVWGLDGEFREVVPFPAEPTEGRISYVKLQGFDDGTLAGLYRRPAAGDDVVQAVVADDRGRPTAELARLSTRQARGLVGGRPAPIPVVRPVPQLVADRAGRIYVTGAEEYEIVAFDGSGTARWRLRVEWPRDPLPAGEVDRALAASEEMLRAMGEQPEVDASSVENVPERLPALRAIKVDGHGHLWVFPHFYWRPGEPASLPPMVPVDVYDRAGERLYAGTIPARFALHSDQDSAWAAAWEDSVWGVETDPETGEQGVVRYRLQEPF